MKLGLLQCDHVLDQFRHIDGDYDAMFARWLPGEWRVYDVARQHLPGNLDECDLWVGTGSKASVYDDEPWIHLYAALVRRLHDSRKPFLGVCFGHQMMGHALGGRVAKSSRGWGVGMHQFVVHQTEPWMMPPLQSVSVLMSCQDQVEDLPPGAVALAGDDHCPAGIFRVGRMLGIQGHPEWTPAYAAALLAHRAQRIGEERAAAARATLDQPAHCAEFANWVRRFVSNSDL